MTEAVEVKRNSMSVVDSIVSEDLGKFPDDNVVEAMPSRIMPANSPCTAGSSV